MATQRFLTKAEEANQIRVMRLTGLNPRYWRADIIALARQQGAFTVEDQE